MPGQPRRFPEGRDIGASAQFIMSGVALIAAVCALAVSLIALFASRGDTTETMAQPVPTATLSPTGFASPDASATETVGGETGDATIGSAPAVSGGPLPSANAEYTLKYQDVKVTLTKQGGCERRVDFDQPLVNAEGNQSDAVFYYCGSVPEFRFSSDQVAIVRSAQATPSECASAIQLSPSSTSVKLSQDLVLCTVTNGQGAVNEPDRAKMVRIVVNSVADDSTTILTLTSWELPR